MTLEIKSLIGGLGRRTTSLVIYAGELGLLLAKSFRGLFEPLPRHHEIVRHMTEIGIRTLPVSGIIVFLLGMVIAFQTAYQMRSLGGEVLIPPLLAVSMTREFGPVMTSLVIAGRVGAANTAVLGSMAVTEQIDAIDAMGVPPVKYLVVPRLIATIAVMPVLTIYTDIVGIFGGFVVSVTKLGLNPQYFFHSVMDALTLKDLVSGIVKSAIFGVLVCVVSCHEGIHTRGGAEGVGRSTMQAVVSSFIMIVLADFFFTLLFYIVQF